MSEQQTGEVIIPVEVEPKARILIADDNSSPRLILERVLGTTYSSRKTNLVSFIV